MTAVVAGHGLDTDAIRCSSEVEHAQGDLEQLVLACNKEGMTFLRKGQYKQAFEQLKYAEAMVEGKQGQDEPTNLMSVTCNNLGCYYKKVGKLHAALHYLRKALKIEVSLQTDDVTVAGTHLNVCAILSKLDKHDKALQHALCALELISNRVNSSHNTATQDEHSVLAIAYHNVAVEYDYSHQYEEAAEAYQQSYDVARNCLGDQHPLTQTLAKNADSALQKSRRNNTKAQVSVARPQPKASELEPPQTSPSWHSFQTPTEREDDNSGYSVRRTNMQAVKSTEFESDPEPSQWRGWMGQDHMQQQQLDPSSVAFPQVQRSMCMQQAKGFEQEAFATPQWKGWSGEQGDAGLSNFQAPFLPPIAGTNSVKAVSRSQFARERPSATTALAQTLPPPMPVLPTNEPATGSRPPRTPGSVPTGRAAREAARKGAVPPAAPPVSRRDQATVPLPQQSQLLRKSAAEKIQRFWRDHNRQKLDAKSRLSREHACATRIQARWRAFHVRRKKITKACVEIQRHTRGFLLRRAMKRHKAAVTIQRYTLGMITRQKFRQAARAAVKIQANVRAAQAQRFVQERRIAVAKAVAIVKGIAGKWFAKQLILELQAEHATEQARIQAATAIQSYFRAGKDRARVQALRAHMAFVERTVRAAIRVQAVMKGHLSRKKAHSLRQDRLQAMHSAATQIQKQWRCFICRKRYLELNKEFSNHVSSIVTLQRYVRGYVVRLRMWRSAIRAEEELWAATEIQRCWRGYLGRLRWELEYEAVWSREAAACRLQRSIRGWLARTKVHRKRKQLARAEFEKARRRFKAAQKIQALVRGVQCRKRVQAFRNRKTKAATTIQRVFRGHRLRCQIWDKEHYRCTVQIQSAARGFIVRRRRFHLLAKVIMIQRNWRRWLNYIPEAERRRRLERWYREHKAARNIQHKFRDTHGKED